MSQNTSNNFSPLEPTKLRFFKMNDFDSVIDVSLELKPNCKYIFTNTNGDTHTIQGSEIIEAIENPSYDTECFYGTYTEWGEGANG